MAVRVQQVARWAGKVALVVALMFLFGASAVWAAPEDYAPDAVGSMFEVPKIGEGQNPTLFEAYPGSSYRVDFQTTGWTSVQGNTIHQTLVGVANVLLMFNQSMIRMAIGFAWHMQSFNVFDAVGAQLAPMIGAVSTSVTDALLPSLVVISAILMFFKAQDSMGEAITQTLAMMAWAGVALSLTFAPATWTDAISLANHGGATLSSKAASMTDTMDLPIAGPTPSFGPDETVNNQRRQGDAMFRTFVVTPWCLTEFGNMKACQDFGEEILSRNMKDRQDYVDSNEFKNALGGADSDAWQYVAGQDGVTRLAIALPSTLSGTVFGLTVMVLFSLVTVFLLLALMLLLVGCVFAALGTVSGRFRTWAINWAWRLFDCVITSSVANFVVSAIVGLSMVIMAATTPTVGWGIGMIMTFMTVITGCLLFREIREIMGIRATGGMGLLGSLGMVSMLGRRFTPRRRRGGRGSSGGDGDKGSGGGSGGSDGGSSSGRDSGGPRKPVPLSRRPGASNSTVPTVDRDWAKAKVEGQLAKHGRMSKSEAAAYASDKKTGVKVSDDVQARRDLFEAKVEQRRNGKLSRKTPGVDMKSAAPTEPVATEGSSRDRYSTVDHKTSAPPPPNSARKPVRRVVVPKGNLPSGARRDFDKDRYKKPLRRVETPKADPMQKANEYRQSAFSARVGGLE